MEFIRPFRHGSELSQQEKWKLERHPLEVAAAVRTTYARLGPDAIAKVPGEVERLKWVGLYPQRQGGDAFMLRVKVPGGRLSAAQARRIGEITDELARGPEPHPVWGDRYCDITTRQTVQVHWLRIGDIPEVWDRLEEVGLTTVQACGDSARNVSCCPVAGIDADEAFDASPVARAISDYFTGNRAYANLPRKFKISVTGCLDDCARAEINDVAFVPARRTDGLLGFNLLVGGGLSDGPRIASDIDVFVAPQDAPECARAIAQLYGELGNRENRGVNRFRYLVQELGPELVRDEIESRAAVELRPAGEALTRGYRGDHVGVHRQKVVDGDDRDLHYVGCSVTVGRMTGADLVALAGLAEQYGDSTLRLTADQNFVVPGIPGDRLESLLAEDVLSRYSPTPGPFSRGVVACTGNEFCRFAIVETKVRAAQWAREMDEQFALAADCDAGHAARDGSDWGDGVVRMHFSGCSASCAQPQIADVAFRGETAHVGESIVEAVDIGLGGGLGPEAGFARWVAGAVPVDDVPTALTAAMQRYLVERRAGETFRSTVRRLGAEAFAGDLGRRGLPAEPAGGRARPTAARPTAARPTVPRTDETTRRDTP
jgi:ferredoxin-nitrite reductase